MDWFGIHEKICQLLGALRTLRPTLGSEDERQRRNLTVQMSQHALIDLSKNEAQKHLVMGQYELAIPGALQSLRFSMEVYGSGRIELVPAYLLLAESNLGLKRYKVAEEFLLYANWSVLKNQDCSNELKSQLYRNFGKLYASQGRFDDALKQLALDVYYSSLESGPEHIDTAGGYFYLADTFLSRGSLEHALAFYDKVVDIWYKFLVNLRHRPEESISDYLSESSIGEAVEMLRSILETRRTHLGSTHIATGEAQYTLGILKHVTGFDLDARNHYQQALAIYTAQLGADNESTLAISRAMDDLPPIPQQLLLKQQAALKAAADSEENRRAQEKHQATLAEHTMVQHSQGHAPLQKADPTDPHVAQQQMQAMQAAQQKARADAANAASSSSSAAPQPSASDPSAPPSALNAQLQQHLDALKQEQQQDDADGGEQAEQEEEEEPAATAEEEDGAVAVGEEEEHAEENEEEAAGDEADGEASARSEPLRAADPDEEEAEESAPEDEDTSGSVRKADEAVVQDPPPASEDEKEEELA